MSSRWWWWPLPAPHDSRPVLFFPPAGADQTVARPLIESAAGMRIGVLRLPGRGPRQNEPAPESLPRLVDEIATSVVAIPGPAPVLVGHSFGGLLAYAVALELNRRGHEPALLMAVATTAPHRWLPHPGEDRLAFATRRTKQVMRLGGMPVSMREDPAIVARVEELVRIDLLLGTGIEPALAAGVEPERLGCRICVLTPTEDLADGSVDPDGWEELTSGTTELITVPGGHFFYRERPALLSTRVRMECALLDDAFEVA